MIMHMMCVGLGALAVAIDIEYKHPSGLSSHRSNLTLTVVWEFTLPELTILTFCSSDIRHHFR